MAHVNRKREKGSQSVGENNRENGRRLPREGVEFQFGRASLVSISDSNFSVSGLVWPRACAYHARRSAASERTRVGRLVREPIRRWAPIWSAHKAAPEIDKARAEKKIETPIREIRGMLLADKQRPWTINNFDMFKIGHPHSRRYRRRRRCRLDVQASRELLLALLLLLLANFIFVSRGLLFGRQFNAQASNNNNSSSDGGGGGGGLFISFIDLIQQYLAPIVFGMTATTTAARKKSRRPAGHDRAHSSGSLSLRAISWRRLQQKRPAA